MVMDADFLFQCTWLYVHSAFPCPVPLSFSCRLGEFRKHAGTRIFHRETNNVTWEAVAVLSGSAREPHRRATIDAAGGRAVE